ncbi:MAG TPA: MtrB/PioB family outer membrane beta-barrel protein, partial [Gemmatimonadales bacterium]
VNTYGGGLSRVMLPGKLDLDLRYHRSDGEDLTRTSTPGTPDLVTTARDYPLVVSDWQSLLATVRYTVSSRVLVSFEYRFEEYEQADFALDVMAPFMGNLDPASAGTTWLGVTRPDFQAHLASLIFSLRL